MKISTIIFLFLFITPIIGSGKGSSSKRARLNPKEYREPESSGTETEQTNIAGTDSTDPNVHGSAEPLASENVPFHEMEHLNSNNPFFHNIPQHMQLHNSRVNMKIIHNEGPKDFYKSKAYRYNWIEGVDEGLKNYHLAEGMKDKKIYVGCNRCMRYLWFEHIDNFKAHNNAHNKLNERMAEISNDEKKMKKLESRYRYAKKQINSDILIPNNKALGFECEACRVNGYNFVILSPNMNDIRKHLNTKIHINSVKRYNTSEQRSINYNDVELEGHYGGSSHPQFQQTFHHSALYPSSQEFDRQQIQKAIEQSTLEMNQSQRTRAQGPMIREPTDQGRLHLREIGQRFDDPNRKGKEIDLNQSESESD
uniref:Uncharacterized protein n=1 Tax=Meloidogyne enterolobii TaxID=390850 RepID=A0A6V7XPJ5_MELEN|nr:unnamed protein product [Meloidogyne enterolobii]